MRLLSTKSCTNYQLNCLYAYTETEDTLFVHLYMEAEQIKSFRTMTFPLTSPPSLGWSSNNSSGCGETNAMTIALRIPEWCNEYEINAPSGDVVEGRLLCITKNGTVRRQ